MNEVLYYAILDYICEHTKTTTYQLRNNVPGFKGDLEWCTQSHYIIDNECSYDAIIIMKSILRDDVIYAERALPSIYIEEGFLPIYPVVDSLTNYYEIPHWLPLTFTSNPAQIRYPGSVPLDLSKSGWMDPMWRQLPGCRKIGINF